MSPYLKAVGDPRRLSVSDALLRRLGRGALARPLRRRASAHRPRGLAAPPSASLNHPADTGQQSASILCAGAGAYPIGACSDARTSAILLNVIPSGSKVTLVYDTAAERAGEEREACWWSTPGPSVATRIRVRVHYATVLRARSSARSTRAGDGVPGGRELVQFPAITSLLTNLRESLPTAWNSRTLV